MQRIQNYCVEIKAGEGGQDSRLFVAELARAYLRLAEHKAWVARAEPLPDLRTGHQAVTLHIQGQNLQLLEAEAGGHRIQRVPLTEKRGRVQSSTVTVAVLSEQSNKAALSFMKREEADFQVSWWSGSGAGGQYRNKHMNSARVTHIPSGIVRSAQTRSRENSLQMAMAALTQELDTLAEASGHQAVNTHRKAQAGSGERSDRQKLWAFQRDVVQDLRTGKSIRCSEALRGHLDRLW